jgi:flagellar biosynthetic protein FliQ
VGGYNISIINTALRLFISSAAPFILAALIGGVIGGIFKTATQIDDKVISFVGKLFAVFLAGALLFSGNIRTLVEFASSVWNGAQYYY